MCRSFRTLSLICAAGVLLVAGPPQVLQPTLDGTVVERRTWPLGAEPRLRIRSDVGKVSLEGWDKAEVEMVATFKPNGQGEHVRLEMDADGQALSLVSTTPKSRSWFSFFGRHGASCALHLKVPRHALVYTRTDVGTIDVEGLRGWLDLASDVGTLTVRGLEGHERGMSLATDVGKIRVDLKGAKGVIDARTDVGRIQVNTPGLQIAHQESCQLRATLKDGKAPIRLRTDVGSITLE